MSGSDMIFDAAEQEYEKRMLAEAEVAKLRARIAELEAENRTLIGLRVGDSRRITALEGRLFALGVMEKAPCFRCGYNGPGYFQPEVHPCAKRHHEATREPGDRVLWR